MSSWEHVTRLIKMTNVNKIRPSAVMLCLWSELAQPFPKAKKKTYFQCSQFLAVACRDVLWLFLLAVSLFSFFIFRSEWITSPVPGWVLTCSIFWNEAALNINTTNQKTIIYCIYPITLRSTALSVFILVDLFHQRWYFSSSRLCQTRQSTKHHTWGQQRAPPDPSWVHTLYPCSTPGLTSPADPHNPNHTGFPWHGPISQP